MIRSFRPGDETAFRELNEAWIREYFEIEAKDLEVLGDPGTHILAPGGEILIACEDDRIVGCCALLSMSDGGFELGKMAVANECRGKGIGRELLERAIALSWSRGATRLYVETSTKLPNAIHLYESAGFRHLPPERVRRSPYARSNVFMELFPPLPC